MANPDNQYRNYHEVVTSESVNKTIAYLNTATLTMSSVTQMIELPEFKELVASGDSALGPIFDDIDNFSHWHLCAVQIIAETLGEPINFSEESQSRYNQAKEEVMRWWVDRNRSYQG